VYVPATGNWYVLLSSTNFTTAMNKSVGGSGYVAVPGDYDGDGRTDLAVYHAASGNWYVLLSGAHYTTSLVRAWGALASRLYPNTRNGSRRTSGPQPW
jgi:hypothetical protein